MSPTPPQWPLRFLRWFCREDFLEEIEGDLIELFEQRYQTSARRAKRAFFWQVCAHFRPDFIRPIFPQTLINSAMYTHYVKVAWRNLYRQKMYSFIKLGGFALGIALFLLIALFVRDELGIDQHYERGDDLYRVLSATHNPADNWTRSSTLPAPAADMIAEQIPEVEEVGRLIAMDGWFLAGGNLFRPEKESTNIYEERFAYADPSLPGILEIPMMYGTREKALSQPQSILISEHIAHKYFPGENPTGETIFLNDDESTPYSIGGVMANLDHTHLAGIDFLITLKNLEFWEGEQADWCCWNYSPYLRLRKGTDPRIVERKLAPIYEKHIVGWLNDQGDQRADTIRKYGAMELQAVGDIHLKSSDVSDFLAVSDVKIVWLYAAIGLFVLLLACINFINLSTAKSANRAKEVGMRKVIGSNRGQLIEQFLSESILLCLIAVILGVALAAYSLPFFNQIANKDLVIPIGEGWFLLSLLALTGSIGLISGLYPAFYLSSFSPLSILRGEKSRGSRSSNLRSGLLVFQFGTSIVLIVGALVVYQQMDFILHKKLGFEKEQVVMIEGAHTIVEEMPAFKVSLLQIPGVQHASASGFLPIEGTRRNTNSFWKAGKREIDQGVPAQFWWVDEHYLETMGMKLVEGRMFERNRASDSMACVINQEMANRLGLQNPIGNQIENWGKWNIVGVVEDFHFDLMTQEIRPLVMVRGTRGDMVSLKIDGEDMEATLQAVEDVWTDFKPHQEFRYSFLDEAYASMYEDVQRTSNVFSIFAILAIIVASLGLFALSAFMVEQRTKEIAVRKILGASEKQILTLLSSETLRLVLLGFSLATPIAWYLMSEWLSGFSYQVDIRWWIFLVAGGIAMLVAIITISFQAVKAAFSNPAFSLRSE